MSSGSSRGTAYCTDSLAWMQVEELRFDSFMTRMRTRT